MTALLTIADSGTWIPRKSEQTVLCRRDGTATAYQGMTLLGVFSSVRDALSYLAGGNPLPLALVAA